MAKKKTTKNVTQNVNVMCSLKVLSYITLEAGCEQYLSLFSLPIKFYLLAEYGEIEPRVHSNTLQKVFKSVRFFSFFVSVELLNDLSTQSSSFLFSILN